MNTTNTALLAKFQQCEKISLNSISGLKWLVRLFVTLSIFSLVITILTIQKTGFSNLFFLASSVTMVMLLFLFFGSTSKIANAYIKGDILIVKYYRKRNPKVMDVRCIRTIKTHSFLGLNITRLEFKFDGVRYRAMLLGNPTIDASAENILRLARMNAA
jgi:hypothetical protein